MATTFSQLFATSPVCGKPSAASPFSTKGPSSASTRELATTETKSMFRYKRFTHVCASLRSFKRGSLLRATAFFTKNVHSADVVFTGVLYTGGIVYGFCEFLVKGGTSVYGVVFDRLGCCVGACV